MWLVRKIHTYAGLLTFVNLTVYGLVGLAASYLLHLQRTPPSVRYQIFTAPPNLTDRQIAERVCTQLKLSLATPVNSFAIQHDAEKNLVLDLRHVNGRHQVTVLEKEGRIRIAETRNSLIHYLFTLHETTSAFHSGDWRMQFWADYNEFAMWSFAAMLISGFAMRIRTRFAQIWLAAGCAVFTTLYFWTR